VDGIYQRDLNVAIEVTFQHAWSSADPFTGVDIVALMQSYSSYWNTNFPVETYPRNSGQLWTGKPYTGGGIAYIGTVCKHPTFAYGVSTYVSGIPSAGALAAHELGHNLGASHVEAADGCASTIMNATQAFTQTPAFCTVSIKTITDYITANGTCLKTRPAIGLRKAVGDFDGDGKSDISVFRPSTGAWYLLNSNTGFSSVQFGLSTDKSVPADYDGDGKTDIAVWRENPNNPDRANFYILNSRDGALRTEQFGRTGDSPMTVGDWDGDGKADPAVYRAGTNGGQSFFFYKPSTRPTVDFVSVAWGIAGDKPVAADYDGDGKADIAVYRPSNGVWYIARSGGGFSFVQFGAAADKPVVGDYDGDGKSDQAVYRPDNGTWYINRSVQGFTAAQFGIATDLLVAADYDGDGKTDIAVYRPAGGNWYISRSSLGFSSVQFGASNDKPTPNAFVP
jgi:hypothetical protein